MIGFVTLAMVAGCGGVETNTEQVETEQSVEELSFQVCPIGQHPGGEITRAWGYSCQGIWDDVVPPLRVNSTLSACIPWPVYLDDERIPNTAVKGLRVDVVSDEVEGWVSRNLTVSFHGCTDSECSGVLERSIYVIPPTTMIRLPSDWGAIWYPRWEVSASGLTLSQHTSIRAYQIGCRFDK